MKIALFIKDLMFSSRIRESAPQGPELFFARSLEDLRSAIAKPDLLLAIFDLSDRDSEEAFKMVKSALPNAFCVGYYPHVDKETADRFKKLGCDKVLPRSRFAREAADLIATFKQ